MENVRHALTLGQGDGIGQLLQGSRLVALGVVQPGLKCQHVDANAGIVYGHGQPV